MMRRFSIVVAAFGLGASPAVAASGPFFSLGNSDFVVLIAFVLFIALLVYVKVPAMLSGFLDRRAATIQTDLDTARALREEAKTLLASYERKQRDVQAQADRIVASAKDEAQAAAKEARAELERAVARRLKAAEDQIASAEASAVREVRERAVEVAIAAAADVLARQMTAESSDAMIDASIAEVGAKLH